MRTELPIEPRGSDSGTATRCGQFLGTASYAPSEQLLGNLDEQSPASDGYRLGAFLHELLTGQPPIASAKSIDDMLRQ